jgi:HrpA-like RNA helicase
MSGLPTLLRPGFIVPPSDMSDSDRKMLASTVSIDYILKVIGNKIPKSRGSSIKIPPKKYGDKVILLKSDTGSGKSTVLPAKLYETFFEQTKKNIAITQPRILTAVDTPNIIVSVPSNSFLEMDKNIGYTTGTFKRLPKESGIIFSTIGVISQQLITLTDEDFMKRYQFIIVDEVHERDIETDLCLFYLKKLIQNNWENPECPLIILTSATFDEKIFMNYFDIPKNNYIQVIGKTFPIKAIYPEYNIKNVISYATQLSKKIHLENMMDLQPETEENQFRDIIIFIQDTKTAETIYKDLMQFNSTILNQSYDKLQQYLITLNTDMEEKFRGGGEIDKSKQYYILPIILNSQNFASSGLEYQNLFSNMDMIHVPLWKPDKNGNIDLEDTPYKYVHPSRRIIIGTNVAETGVTIPTLKYCIDSGYQFNVEFQPNFNCNLLAIKNISKGSAIQRKGRVGRKAPGEWHPCYTESTFNYLKEDNLSQIIISDPTENLLGILIKEKECEIVEEKSINVIKNNKNNNLFQMFNVIDNYWYVLNNKYKSNISSLDFIELPSMQSLSYSIEKLHILGFIDDNYDVTTVGYFANQIRFITLECKKMILSGYHYGANILDLITISSFIYATKRKVFSKNFTMKNFLKIANDEFNFYNTILIADDFINCLFIWNILQKYIHSHIWKLDIKNVDAEKIHNKKLLYLKNIEEWCDENGLIFEGIIKVIEIRDTIIENLITIGLDPYKNSLGLTKSQYNLNNIFKNSFSDGISEIKKIKECIYEGFKCNLLINVKNNYMLGIKNIPIAIKSKFIGILNNDNVEQNKPKYVIISGFSLSKTFNSAVYNIQSNDYISVLDNFITIDEYFVKY